MKLNESLREKYNSQYQKSLLEKWDPNIKAVKDVYPKFSNISATNLAILCENTDEQIKKYQRLNEGTQAADVGAYIRHAFEMITAVMPNLVSEEVVSVQALNQKIGQIFFLKFVYGSNKGTTQKGSTAFGPYEVNSQPNYTSEHVDQELIADGTSASVTASLGWGPVLANSVTVTSGAVTLTDKNGDGILYEDSTQRGTIDYNSGAISITFASSTGEDVNVEYDYSLEYAPTQAPQFDMEVKERIVRAKPRSLRTNYAFAAAYDVEKQFGIDMDKELLEASITEIRHEIDQEILGDLYRQAGLTDSWDMTTPLGISDAVHYETFKIALNRAANKIRQATKRAKGNVAVLGVNALTVVESMSGFIPANATDKVGAYVAGTIKGQMKIICNPFYGEDDYLVAYKGDSFIDAGYVYAPYLPVFATQVIMLDDFVGRRGYATSYAKAMLNPTYYVRCKITHLPRTVSANVTVVNDEEHPVPTKEIV